ncbi:hypothetical protein OG456_50045 [Streptomyces sp. NBC_01446]|nr:hypothetical protein [Streptomyces sp. NBC_01446]MCX5327763.1 hypothetical protein [Streptomyces sp. NBC_00120]
MRAVLESREKSALVRVEERRAEFERVRTALAEAEEVLNHRVIGLEQYLEALDEQDACVDMESGGAAGAGVEEPVVAVPRRTVARKEDGVPVDVLGADYRRIMTVLGEADGSLTARQTAVALGWDSSVASRVEGARGKLKRLVERGWLVEERPGRFTLPASGSADAVAA